MNILNNALVFAFGDIERFSRHILKRPLRSYQVDPARALVASIIRRDGEHYVWRFPRQSGKNETIAHVTAYVLFLYQRVVGSTIVHTAPTYDPQAANAQRRVMELVRGNSFFVKLRERDNEIELGEARVVFLSGKEREKPNVGSTASLALIKDEAQDLDQTYIEQTFDPMTTSTNAPHLHTGTARMLPTYLTAKRKELEQRTDKDKKQRIWVIGWRDVARENPAYGQRVAGVIEVKGPSHPVVVTEYENIESDDTAALFNPRRVGLMFGATLARQLAPIAGRRYAATIDVGGTSATNSDRDHDPTVIAFHEADTQNGLVYYKTIHYWECKGDVLNDTQQRRDLFAMLDQWKPYVILPDATGLGIGLANALSARYRGRVMPIVWSEAQKTEALNEFLALIETGRYQHYGAVLDEALARVQMQFSRIDVKQKGKYYSYGIADSVTWMNPFTQKIETLHDDHMLVDIMTGLLPAKSPAVVSSRQRDKDIE